MAYVSQETKKQVSPAIKSVLKKYGVKGTIGVNHHSTLVVTLKSGKLDIIQNWFDNATKYGNTNNYGDVITKPEYMDVNEYWIDSNYTGIVKNFLNELLDAMKTPNWRDNSDIQSDYFDISYYTDIKCGRWNKPYTVEV